jgi:AraC-like DNA-binding protein
VDLAAECMLNTDAPLSEIALRCGLADQAHLCKVFRQFTGQTPAAWRRVRRASAIVSPESRQLLRGPRLEHGYG